MQPRRRRNRIILGVLALGLLAGVALTAHPAQAQAVNDAETRKEIERRQQQEREREQQETKKKQEQEQQEAKKKRDQDERERKAADDQRRQEQAKIAEQKRKEDDILSPRQQQIVEGLVDGLSYKLIADKLSISIDTVRDHII